jgi:hypothetical protein
MRRLVVVAIAVACSAPAKSPASISPADWTARCAARLDAARTKLALGGATKTDPTPWNPHVRFEVHTAGGYYEASVTHGRDACSDYDSDEPSFTNLKWSNSAHASKIALDRIRRVQGDEAAIEADKVPRETIEPFRAAFEEAIEACLQDARAVPLGAVPRDFSCIDKADRCPDTPNADAEADGCPTH